MFIVQIKAKSSPTIEQHKNKLRSLCTTIEGILGCITTHNQTNTLVDHTIDFHIERLDDTRLQRIVGLTDIRDIHIRLANH